MQTPRDVGGELSRRSALGGAAAALGWAGFGKSDAVAQERAGRGAPVGANSKLKITKLETIPIKPRWLFLKVHTDAGIIGLGEPIVEGRALHGRRGGQRDRAILAGQGSPTGGAPLASDLPARLLSRRPDSDQRLERNRHGPLGHQRESARGARLRTAGGAHAGSDPGVCARGHGRPAQAGTRPRLHGVQDGSRRRRPARYVETPAEVHYAADRFAELRRAAGDDVDIAIDFHGAISPATAKLLIKALEPHQPMFVEEPCQAQNHDVMAELARGTHLPIATGERVFTKWGFREVLEKRAATILQPDLCHAGGITEVRLIAGMAEAYYAAIAPHNPLGPISLAAGVQIAASIPNFLCQEQVSLGDGYLKAPFTLRQGFLDLPTGPGLGIELDENALADKIGHDWKNRESYDADDGSVMDW